MSGTAVGRAMSSSYRSLSLIEARTTFAWKQAVLATVDEWVTASFGGAYPSCDLPGWLRVAWC